MADRTLTVKIVGDDASLQRAFNRSEKRAQTFGVKVQGIGKSVAAGAFGGIAAASAGQAILHGIQQSIDEASNLSEQINKNRAVFKESGDEVVDWSKTTATAIGISAAAALEATGTFGNLFNTVGLAPAAGAKMSETLVELAADLASFNNASPEDVLLAIRSGLIGEAEPLRKYGVLLSETRVQQEAMAATGKKSAASLTDQEKALARYNIILHDTVPAQGDFARTSGGLANQTRKLNAQVSDLAAAFGGLLIPKVLETVGAVNDLIGAWRRLQNAIPGGKGKEATDSFFGEFFKSLPAIIEDQVDNLKRMGEDVDLILQGKGFQPKPKPVFDALEKALTQGPEDLLKALKNVDLTYAKIAEAAVAGPKALNAALLKWKAELDKAQKKADEVSQHKFDEFVLGLGLKFDKAQLTKSTNDDLAALRELESGIQRRIAAEGKTFKLVTQLVQVRGQIAGVLADQVAASAQASSDAYSEAISMLELRLDMAGVTKGFNDDLRVLRLIESAILARIAAEGRTADLLQQLFNNRQAQAETLRNQRNAAAFEALGLTAEGDKPTPGGNALLKRARSLRDQVKGTTLDTTKTRTQLNAIVNYLTTHFRTAGKEVRDAILGMLNDISSALDSGGEQGPLTKFAKRGVGNLIKGLGLSEDQTKEIRQRFSQLGARDFAAPVRAGAPRPPRDRPTAEDMAAHRGDRDVTVNVYIDGSKVEPVITKRQQKTQGRNRPQRRGVRPGR